MTDKMIDATNSELARRLGLTDDEEAQLLEWRHELCDDYARRQKAISAIAWEISYTFTHAIIDNVLTAMKNMEPFDEETKDWDVLDWGSTAGVLATSLNGAFQQWLVHELSGWGN